MGKDFYSFNDVIEDALISQGNPYHILSYAIKNKKFKNINLIELIKASIKVCKAEQLESLTQLAIRSQDAEIIYHFAYYAPLSQTDVLGEALLKLGDIQYLRKFQHHILGLNAESFGNNTDENEGQLN